MQTISPEKKNVGQDVFHQYRLATQAAALAGTPDQEADAYMRVVRYCEDNHLCSSDESVKRNSVMFWSYNNIGDALVRKHQRFLGYKNATQDYRLAIENYTKALRSARDGAEKVSTLNKIAKAYKLMGNKNLWLKTHEQIIGELAEEYKYAAYLKLAKKAGHFEQAVLLLENALTHVMQTKRSVLQKFRDLLDVCAQLLPLYHKLRLQDDEKRIQALSRRAAILLMTAIENRIMHEKDRNKRRVWYDQLLKTGNKYLARDKLWRLQMLQQLQHELHEQEVWLLAGEKFSLQSIEKTLHKNKI